MDIIRAGHLGDIKVSVVHDRMSPEEKLESNREEWREDRIWETPEGFTLVEKGRDGTVYYRRGESTIEFYWEFSGLPTVDVSFSTPAWQWIDVHRLIRSPVSSADRTLIRQKLIDYLAGRGANFVLEGKTYRFRKVQKSAPTKRGAGKRGSKSPHQPHNPHRG
jgi:hypothetical protein